MLTLTQFASNSARILRPQATDGDQYKNLKTLK